MSIEEFLILEKRIAQISSNLDVIFAFDVIKTTHTEERSNFAKRGLPGPNQRHISNSEMSELISHFKGDISESIAKEDIVDETEFVIRSLKRSLSMAILAKRVSLTYWKLIVKTVFRESDESKLKIGNKQLVFDE